MKIRTKVIRAGLTPPVSLMNRSISVSGGLLNNFTRKREELLRRAGALIRGIREGWLRLKIDRVFPLAEAAEAQRRLESRESIGKIILKTKAWSPDAISTKMA